MASSAGRKKSIVVPNGLVQSNNLLNQAATTSLYQECSRLRSRLLTVRGFEHFFALVAAEHPQSTDPVTQLWDLFSFGIPLCYLFDQLPQEEGFSKINHSEFNQEQFEANPDRAKKHAIALFAMQIRSDKVQKAIPNCEPFTITDLSSRSSNDGLVKVVKTVAAIVNHLPPEAFDQAPPSPPFLAQPEDSFSEPAALPSVGSKEAARNNIIREILDTERKYVQDLEIMQKYATALAQGNVIDQDTIHLLFPNLNKLLNFQRKFLIRLESTAEMPWQDQRWGLPFIECEDEFIVYEPYCANYNAATELMLVNEQNLSTLNHVINVKVELPAFLIKPVQRVCKYPLLLDSLIKASSAEDTPNFDELRRGSEAAKRITDKINEAQRQAENEQTVKNLQMRVDDWKGHHLENFGKLLLDDIFIVTKSDIDREYHVFLFEKIILCCKESLPPVNGKKVGKSNSILKKQPNNSIISAIGGTNSQKKTTPLLLKGRIFLGNVTQAVPAATTSRNSVSGVNPSYPLAVWWRGDDDLEFFTLRCRWEDQMRTWESTINRLIKEAAQRRASERGMSRIVANSTNPRINGYNSASLAPGCAPPPLSALSSRPRPDTAYASSEFGSAVGSAVSTYSGPSGYPQHNVFEMEENDEDDFEEYPNTSGYPPSGRGTPMGSRRPTTSLPPEQRDHAPPYMGGNRAQTEGADGPVMAQWRNNNGLPVSAGSNIRPPLNPRMNSNSSYGSDGSFGPGVPRQRQPLRSQFSSTKLRTGYESSGEYRPPPTNPLPPQPALPPSLNRSRSASQPSAYVPKGPAPPLPTWNQQSNGSTTSSNKRGSGSSQSTGDSSDYSPNSSSPITPFGSSESSLGGIRPSRSQNFDALNGNPYPVKVKVHFHEDIFVIQVPRATEYEDLVEKVGRKIRLCGPRRDDGPLRVKYRDEDGDMISLGSTEDVQMAFEHFRPGGQVTLFVT